MVAEHSFDSFWLGIINFIGRLYQKLMGICEDFDHFHNSALGP